MPSEIERFEPFILWAEDGSPYIDMVSAGYGVTGSGDYVRYSDHIAALASLPDRTGEPVVWQHYYPEHEQGCPVSPETIVEGFCLVTGSWGTPCPASMVPWTGVNHVVVYRVATSPDAEQAGLRERENGHE